MFGTYDDTTNDHYTQAAAQTIATLIENYENHNLQVEDSERTSFGKMEVTKIQTCKGKHTLVLAPY